MLPGVATLRDEKGKMSVDSARAIMRQICRDGSNRNFILLEAHLAPGATQRWSNAGFGAGFESQQSSKQATTCSESSGRGLQPQSASAAEVLEDHGVDYMLYAFNIRVVKMIMY